jgi:hypothetical protein
MRRVIFSLVLMFALAVIDFSAEAQTPSRAKRVKKLSIKEQLVQEKLKSDSLAGLVEE